MNRNTCSMLGGVALVVSALVACDAQETPHDDPNENDASEITANEETAILGLLSGATQEQLLDPAGGRLLPEEADEVLAIRSGPDGIDGNEDDVLFDDLEQVEAMRHGASLMEKMIRWADELGFLDPGTTLEVHRGVLQLDCDSLTPEELEEAIEAGDCAADEDGVGFRSLVDGNCGRSQFFISRADTGVANFVMSLSSTRGTMLLVRYNVLWINHSTWDPFRLHSGTDFPVNSVWNRRDWVRTKTGNVCGTFSGSVLLSSLQTCSIRHPDDCYTI